MKRPPRTERRAWARANAWPLGAFFAVTAMAGLWLGNIFALAAGLGGLGWIGWAFLKSE